MSDDGGVMSSQEMDHVSPTEVTPELGKGALDTWRPDADLPESGELLVAYHGRRENAVRYTSITKSIDLATSFNQR